MLSVNMLSVQPNISYKGIKKVPPVSFSSNNNEANKSSNIAFTADSFWQRFLRIVCPPLAKARDEVTDAAQGEVSQFGNFISEIMSSHVKPKDSVLVGKPVPAFGKSLNILA